MNDALENGNRIMGNLVWRAISSFHIRVCLVALTAFGLTTVDTTYGQLRFRGEQEPLQMNGPLPPEFNPSTQPAELDFSATPIAMQNSIQEIQFHEVDPEIPDATEEADLTSDSSDELPQPDQPSTATMEFENGTLGVPSDQEFSIYANQQQPLLYSTNDAFRRGHYYAKADIVMMLKSQVENVLVAVDASGARAQFRRSLDTTDAGMTFESGTRITFGRFLGQDVANRDVAFEFSFLGGFDYFATASLVGTQIDGGNSLLSAIDTSDPVLVIFTGTALPSAFDVNQAFNFVNDQTIRYSSDFNSAEFNFRILGRPLRDRVALQPNGSWVRHASSNRIKSGLLGFRYASVNDYFDLQSNVGDVANSFGNYSVNTHNDMFGIQVGGEFEEVYASWSWGAQFKTAGLINFVDRDSALESRLGNTFSSTSESLTDEHLAILIEAGVKASYRIKPNMIVRTGYDFMYLSGIATAPPNLGLQFPKFEVNGDTFMHGISFGVEMLW